MKIRLSQLKKIIREEVSRSMVEAVDPTTMDALYSAMEAWRDSGDVEALDDVVGKLIVAGDEPGMVIDRIGELAGELGFSGQDEIDVQEYVSGLPGMGGG